MREGFVFYRSFAKALRGLDAQTKAAVLDVLCDYALDGIEPQETGVVAALFELMRPQVDANNRKYESGKKGGRPKNEAEQDRNQTETRQNQTETKLNQEQTKQKPNTENPKPKEKEKAKEKVKDIKHKYGVYTHVLLTEREYMTLLSEYGPETTAEAIRLVDEYCETSGKRYKNYNLVIRRWGIQQAADNLAMRSPPKQAKYEPAYDFDEIERILVSR